MSTIQLTVTYTVSDFICAFRALPLGMSRLWVFPLLGFVFVGVGVVLDMWQMLIAGCVVFSMVFLYPIISSVQLSRCPT